MFCIIHVLTNLFLLFINIVFIIILKYRGQYTIEIATIMNTSLVIFYTAMTLMKVTNVLGLEWELDLEPKPR